MKFDASIQEKSTEQEFNMEETRAIVLSKAQDNSSEIKALTDKLDLGNMNTVVTFGKEATEEISKISDTVLRNVELDKINDAGTMLTSLGKIMDRFDPKELSATEKKGVIAKFFNNAQKQLEAILNKYNTMGDEVDKIYIQLKQYENEIHDSNNKLEQLFVNNLDYYQLLTKYILAGEDGVKEIEAYKQQLEKQYQETGDQTIHFNIQNLEQGKIMLEQRVQDLRMAENVAMQSIPMLKAMQFSNMNLVRKINSAFIITLPVFKQSLAQAVLLKRQRIQSDALSALDARTNEMLLRNAQNTVEQTKLTTQLASGSSVKIETLEQTWQIIQNGIEETRKIQEEATRKRNEDKNRLEQMKNDFSTKMLGIKQ